MKTLQISTFRLVLVILISCTSLIKICYSQSEKMPFAVWSSTTGSQNFFYKNVSMTDDNNNI